MVNVSFSFDCVAEAVEFFNGVGAKFPAPEVAIGAGNEPLDASFTVVDSPAEVEETSPPVETQATEAPQPEQASTATSQQADIGDPPAEFKELLLETNALGKELMTGLAEQGEDKLKDEVLNHFEKPVNNLPRAELEKAWRWLKEFKAKYLGGAN